MKTSVWSAILVPVVCLLLAACDYDVPLTAAATQPINPALLGNWREVGEKPGGLNVRRYDANTYLAVVDGDVYRVFHSEIAGRHFVSVQDLNSDPRKYCYYLWELSPGGAELTLRRVSTKIVPDTVASPEAAQKLVADHLGDPKLLEEPTVFVREKR